MLEDERIKLRYVPQVTSPKTATNSQIQEMLRHASEINKSESYPSGQAIQSQEYTKSADDVEYDLSHEQEGMISIKQRLLQEEEDKEMEILHHKDDDLIDEGSMMNNDRKNGISRPHSESQNSEVGPLISEAQLSML